jgi:hypothetical protein
MFREQKMFGNGAGDRIRTGDIDLGKVALYQLSYSREGTAISPSGEHENRRPPTNFIVARGLKTVKLGC